MNYKVGDHVIAAAQPAIIITMKRDTVKVRFEDGSTEIFFPEEIEIARLLSESPTVFYFQCGGDVLLMAHGSRSHYCVRSQWEKSKAFKRAGKTGPSLSMAPEKMTRGFTGAQKI